MEFYRTALSLGYNETKATEFVDQMNGVIEVTSLQSLYENMHTARMGGGRGFDRSVQKMSPDKSKQPISGTK